MENNAHILFEESLLKIQHFNSSHSRKLELCIIVKWLYLLNNWWFCIDSMLCFFTRQGQHKPYVLVTLSNRIKHITQYILLLLYIMLCVISNGSNVLWHIRCILAQTYSVLQLFCTRSLFTLLFCCWEINASLKCFSATMCCSFMNG